MCCSIRVMPVNFVCKNSLLSGIVSNDNPVKVNGVSSCQFALCGEGSSVVVVRHVHNCSTTSAAGKGSRGTRTKARRWCLKLLIALALLTSFRTGGFGRRLGGFGHDGVDDGAHFAVRAGVEIGQNLVDRFNFEGDVCWVYCIGVLKSCTMSAFIASMMAELLSFTVS